MERKRATKEILIRENVRNKKAQLLEKGERNGWRKEVNSLKKFLDELKTSKPFCKRTRELERQMKEGKDEKNNKRELKHVLKMASEQMRGWRESLGCF